MIKYGKKSFVKNLKSIVILVNIYFFVVKKKYFNP